MSWTYLEKHAYWFVFAGAFLAFAALESFRPRRTLLTRADRRWTRHGVIALIVTVILTVIYRTTPVMMAVLSADNHFGLLNRPWLPPTLRWVLGFLLLDLSRYFTHASYHRFSLLWRLHQVHHSDPDFDVSTGIRVHPLESILTQGATIATIALLAPPAGAVLVNELAQCCHTFFEHANINMPRALDRYLRWFVVTPDMHRVHHSAEMAEQYSNLGELLPWWDRLFRTYQAQPAAGHEKMIVGQHDAQNERTLGLAFMLLQPFRPTPSVSPEQKISAAAGD